MAKTIQCKILNNCPLAECRELDIRFDSIQNEKSTIHTTLVGLMWGVYCSLLGLLAKIKV